MRFLTAILLSSALSAPAFANQTYTTEVVKTPGNALSFQRVLAFERDNVTRVSGRITSISRVGLPSGHVDVAAYSSTGKLLAESSTTYSPSVLTRNTKREGGVRFAVELPGSLPTDSVVKVAFHQDLPTSAEKPSHNENIAR